MTLEGLRILDLSRYAPGLFATARLADLGAEVITVEAPKRMVTAGIPRYGGEAARNAGLHPSWAKKRSITLDLKSQLGRDAFLQLAGSAHVVVEGFRPGVCDRLGIGYSMLSQRSPSLVFCSITGYGQTGDYAQRAGHDLNYIARSGLLAAATRPGQAPGIPVNVVADIAAGGLRAALAVVAALYEVRNTGVGKHLDVSMTDGVVEMMAPAMASLVADGADVSWAGGTLSGAAPFYDCYQTSDDEWLSVAAIEPVFFARVCEVLDLAELIPHHLDETRWDDMRTAFTRAFSGQTRAHWCARFESTDATVEPVLSLREASEVHPFHLPSQHVVAPGVDTADVLADAGVPADQIQKLLDAAAQGQPAQTTDPSKENQQ